MYLNDYTCVADRNLGGLGDLAGSSISAVDASKINWSRSTLLPTSGNAGQDTYTNPGTYINIWAGDSDWLNEIGFLRSPQANAQPIVINPYFELGGEAGGRGFDQGLVDRSGAILVEGGGVDPVSQFVVTPLRQYEMAAGLQQQIGYLGSTKYVRYVDKNGVQVGNIRQWTDRMGDVIGKIVQVVATVAVAYGAAAAASAVASGVTGAGTASTAAAPAAGTTATIPEAITSAAAAAPEVAAAAVPAVAAPAAATGLTVGSVASALPTLSTVAKGIATVLPIVKTGLDIKAQQDAAAARAAQTTQMPTLPLTTNAGYLQPGGMQFEPFPGSNPTPQWVIPAAIGGAALLLLLVMGRQQQGSPSPKRRASPARRSSR